MLLQRFFFPFFPLFPSLLFLKFPLNLVFFPLLFLSPKIGSVNINEVGLGSLSRTSGNYYQRQLDVWYKQYQVATQYVHSSSPSSSSVPEVEKLVDWLGEMLKDKGLGIKKRGLFLVVVSNSFHFKNVYITESEKCGGGFLVHGDFRIDNLVFHPTKPIILAVLDWELSALGLYRHHSLFFFPLPLILSSLSKGHPYNDLASLCIPYYGGFASAEDGFFHYYDNQ